MKKLNLSAGTFLAIISFSIAGSVIYELPYIKYVYYDKFVEAFGMTNAQAGFLLSAYAIGCLYCIYREVYWRTSSLLKECWSCRCLEPGFSAS